MASICDLPVEIHTSILKYLHTLSHEDPGQLPEDHQDTVSVCSGISRYTYARSSRPVISESDQATLRSRIMFPFNTAYAYSQWRDILIYLPTFKCCWEYIILDVARDPTPFLDALWRPNMLNVVRVFVFNSSPKARSVDAAVEGRRVYTIAEAFKWHVAGCKSIVFDVAYSSSLPPLTFLLRKGAPKLKVLILDSTVDNIDVRNPPPTWSADSTSASTSTSNPISAGGGLSFMPYPKIRVLALPGFWFVHLAENYPKLFELPPYSALYISRFRFSRDGGHTIPKFALRLSQLPEFISIDLYGLSLAPKHPVDASRPSADEDFAGSMTINANPVVFRGVSRSFVTHLYSIADISPRGADCLNCEPIEMPDVSLVQDMSKFRLRNINDEDEDEPSGIGSYDF
ncbi:hypothetical protein GALMADRAFT_254709 [Galerina marginata CBS 339.88]|uniref:F-box domain-containing protein n=1 Tax=Galerina marginata (strain CBS 339.88) TaxID=685588 RepID=A0A067SV68_GALM3|nr:hypothetical protein GALMADRAFT_254709 [Galerina marginata CBS 339.88]